MPNAKALLVPHWTPEEARGAVISRIVHLNAHRAPDSMPAQPWWTNLAPDFALQSEHFHLRPWDRLRVEATAVFDVVARTWASTMLAATAIPLGYRPHMLRQMQRDAAFYKSIADQRDPHVFFADPPHHVHVERAPAHGTFFDPMDGVCEDLSFESPFVPVNPRLRPVYSGKGRNRTAHLRYFRHHGGNRPTVIAIHGFMADIYALNEWFFAVPWFYEMGCNVAIFTLPFHGRRQSILSPFSGHGFFSGGVGRVNEAFAQAIMDLRIFINHLEDTYGIDRIGATGVSLGGYTTALLAAVEPRLRFAIPNVPVVSIPDLLLEWEPIGLAVRALLRSSGVSLEELRHMMAAHSPLTYRPVIERERLMIIGGAGDRLCPPKHPKLLWDHWGRPRIHWYPGSHLVHLDKGHYLKQMALFLSDIGFLDVPMGRKRRWLNNQ
ncbi:MAG: prolyl oligopeptidase family serine peptidase [Myxococcales bacterium]